MGKERKAPTQTQAQEALQDLRKILHPPRKKGTGHVDPELNIFVRTRLEGMQTMLNFYVNKQSRTYNSWTASLCQAAVSLSRGLHCAWQLHKLTRQYIKDCTMLPLNPYGDWNETMLVNEDLTNEINIYLLSIGNEISGEKLRDFVNSDDVRSWHGIDRKISMRTAQRYLKVLGYRYGAPKKDQYVDGHECEDVVFYQEQVFLPQWQNICRLCFSDDMRRFDAHRLVLSSDRTPQSVIRARCQICFFYFSVIFYSFIIRL